jgi:hypothetical protein
VTGPYLYTYAPKRLTYIPKEMDVYYGTELSAVVHTNYTPLRENPHLEPRFPDGGWVGRFRFLCCVAVLDVAAAPVEGGGPTLPLWGRVVTFLVVCFVLLCFESLRA